MLTCYLDNLSSLIEQSTDIAFILSFFYYYVEVHDDRNYHGWSLLTEITATNLTATFQLP